MRTINQRELEVLARYLHRPRSGVGPGPELLNLHIVRRDTYSRRQIIRASYYSNHTLVKFDGNLPLP